MTKISSIRSTLLITAVVVPFSISCDSARQETTEATPQAAVSPDPAQILPSDVPGISKERRQELKDEENRNLVSGGKIGTTMSAAETRALAAEYDRKHPDEK